MSRKLYWTFAADQGKSQNPLPTGPRGSTRQWGRVDDAALTHLERPAQIEKEHGRKAPSSIFSHSLDGFGRRFRSLRFGPWHALQIDPARCSHFLRRAYSRRVGGSQPLHPYSGSRTLCRPASFLGDDGGLCGIARRRDFRRAVMNTLLISRISFGHELYYYERQFFRVCLAGSISVHIHDATDKDASCPCGVSR